VDQTQLDPLAACLVQGFLETAAHSRQLTEEYGVPPTTMAKRHHLRYVTQVAISHDERFRLGTDFSEFGKIQLTDVRDGNVYLFRSDSSNTIERARFNSNQLFEMAPQYIRSDVILLVYRFAPHGLELSVSGTKQQAGRKRLEASGDPDYVGIWTYDLGGSVPPFDQEEENPFDELGDLGEDEGEEAAE
jgi:hypothetical protein